LDFKKTPKQIEATKLLGSSAKHVLLAGGSRSGKTFKLVRAIIIRACKTQSRHISLRKHFNSIKTSLWHETLPAVLNLCFPDLPVKWNRSDYYITFPNGSEYWVGGLDDQKRAEKILGKEYSTIHFNEISELDFSSVQLALTRLAQKNDLYKRAYYDCNPPPKSHWAYWQFIKRLNPADNEPILNPDNYQHMIMNPKDNMDNLDEEYLAMLEALPEKERNRFLNGEFSDVDDGAAYYSFNRDNHVKKVNRAPGTVFSFLDFNVSPGVAVIAQFDGDRFYIFDEIWIDDNSDTYKIAAELKKRGYIGDAICDSTGANRKTSGKTDYGILREYGFNVLKTRNPFQNDRVNNLNRLLANDKIIIDPKCKKLINDLEKVSWKDNLLDQKTDKSLTHITDALGYGCWKLAPLSMQKGSATVRQY